MSDNEEKNSNDEEKTRINQDEGSNNPKTITEGNVSLDSNKNTENGGAIPESVPLKEAGDDKVRILLDNLELDKIEAELTEMSKELINTDAGKDAGDYTDEAKVSAIDDKKVEDVNTKIDAKVSKTNVTVEKDESNDSSLDKSNEKESMKADDLDEIEDDDIELRWDDDDDDASNHAMGDDNRNADTKNDDTLSKGQLLEDPSDVSAKDMTEMPSDGNPKVSKANLDSDVLKVNSEENSLTRDDNAKEIETTVESEISPKLDILKDEKILVDMRLEENDLNTEEINSPEMDFSAGESMDRDDINVLEEKLLKESESTEEINSPEMDFSAEESMDRDDINVLEEKLLEESEIVTEATVIAPAKEILEEKSMDEPIKEIESAKTNLLTEVTNDEKTREDPVAIIEEDKLLAESKSNTEMESSTFKLKSFTDVILNKNNDDIMSEEKLLEEPDSKSESSLNISDKLIECSKIVPEKEATMNKEDNDDALLEEKLLQETETAEIIPESDITMDVDNEEEGELLKDDECPEDSCTPMDVDNSDTPIGAQAKVEDKIIDQTMNQSEVAKKGIALPIEDQTNIEKVDKTTDDVKNMDRSDDQSTIIEKVIDQPVKDTSKAVDIVRDTPIEDEVKIDEDIVDQAVSEKERIDQQIDDQTKMDDSNEDQLILESNTKEQSIKSPVQTDALTVSNTPNILVEDLEKHIPKETTLVEEIKIKTDPKELKENTENIYKDTDLDEPEKSKEMINPDTSLDNNKEVDEISFSNNSSIFLEVSCPIKTDHGVHKPDVMLEIPTQELIDMDDTDLSMNLDHSVMIDSLNDVEKIIDDDIVHDKTIIDETVVADVIGSDKIVTDNSTVSEKSVEQAKVDEDTTREKPVDQKALVTESTVINKIIAEDDVEKPVDQEAIETEITTVDKIIADEDTVKEKSVVQEAIVTESTVGEVQTVSNIVESDKKVEDTVVQATPMATVEENMERMFADDEPEVVKEIAECIASTSQVEVPPKQPSAPITRMTPDTSDEVPEIDDSLGLLAESAGRMMEDDEEPDDDFDGDDDDDFDNDESSNQISAEQSEDSNPAALESELARDQEDKELETPDPKDEEFMMCDSTSQDKAEKMDVEEEYGTVELQAESINEINEEAKSAVDALLNADNPASEQVQDQQETTDQMDIETVKLSDTSDNEVDVEPTEVQQAVAKSSKEEEKQKRSPSKSPSKSNISPKQSPSKSTQSPSKQSPSKMKNLAIATQALSAVVNIVDLEESSSSEDDIQEVQKQLEPQTTQDDTPPSPESDVTNVNIPTGIDIMCTSGGNTSEITTKDNLSQVVISGVPKPPPHKPARLNTSEVSIKTVSNTEPLIIPETKINEQTQTQSKPKLSLEIFSLDSDDDESAAKEKLPPTSPHKMTALELEKARETSKCINYCCTSDNKVPYKLAEASEIAYYDAGRKRRSMVCQPCADVVAARTKNLIQGIKDLTPLLDLDMGKLSQDLVEISDSESEDEVMSTEEPKESIGEKGAKFIEDNLAKYLNDTWKKYDMDVRLTETQIMLDDEIEKLEQDSKEIDAMLNECQVATDKLRCELYATFECRRQQLPSLTIYDTPESKFIGLENPQSTASEAIETRQAKRRLSSTSETPAKRPAIPLGYAPLDGGDSKEKAVIPAPDNKLDDDKDISVVKLSAEAAPAELPPPGEISRPPLRVGMPVYAMKNAFGPWLKGRVVDIQPKNTAGGNPFSVCLVKFDHKVKTNGKVLPARCIAYSEPADVRMTIGTRLIALFKDSNKRESYYSGVVAEIPNPVNNYRYLVFFDDGYAQYVQHQFTRLVCESSPLVWEEVHPFSREFVRQYLMEYPERPMVRLHEGQHLKTEWNGKWWSSRVTRVDASLAQVMFVGDGRREWIYRGSTRLAPLYLELRAAERHRPRPMPRSKAQPRFNMPYVEYTRSDEQESTKQVDAQAQPQQQQEQQQQQIQNEEIRRQRAVAKKSTSAPPQVLPPSQQVMPTNTDTVTSRVVYYTPKNAVKPLKMVPHRCGPRCKRSDVLSLKELRTYNPLAKPLLSGWERQIVRFKGHKEVMYRAPCGRRLRNMRELHQYLRSIDSDLPVDLFDFHYSTHCLAEFVLNKCLVGKKDLSHGKENVPVPCVNYYDDSLPEFCSYNTERTPTAGVPLNLEPEFLCGCDCTDDCQDKSKCACWKMTLEGARTIGLRGPNLGYVYKRLPEPLPSGIYECNSRCKCKHTCLNRVAQHPLQLKLQVFKTPNRGWGIRALNDVPKGSFLCVYAGNLLTDATANLDGLNEGDEYLAELDYIEVVEQMKEGYEEDIPEADKKLDKKEGKDGDDSDEDEPSSSEDEETADKTDKEDDDFRPGYIGLGVTEFSKRLRKREKSKKDKEDAAGDEKEKDKDTNKESNAEEDCITISDDEEVREPSRFMAQTNMGASEYISKYKSVRTLFGKDEACYIMDAKVQGNIGRYLNHSCCPNVFVQNVFVDTHDPRFPWVAFFALSHIKAGTELTWNYNYDVGSVPGKILYCYCGAPNCRGRLL